MKRLIAYVVIKAENVISGMSLEGSQKYIDTEIEALSRNFEILSVSYEAKAKHEDVEVPAEIIAPVKSNDAYLTNLFTIAAELQVYKYIYSTHFSKSLEEIKAWFDSVDRNNHTILHASVRLGENWTAFKDRDEFYRIINEYGDGHSFSLST